MDILSFELGKKLGGGGQPSPTPSSGYVEDKLLYYYEGNEEKLLMNSIITSPASEYATIVPLLNTSDGWTIEAYFQIDGTTSQAYQGVFGIANGRQEGNTLHVDIYIGEISNDIYKMNVYLSWGNSYDDIYALNMEVGKKYTFTIMSIPNDDKITANALVCYLDGVQVGTSKTLARDSYLTPTRVGIAESSMAYNSYSRPMNGKLYNGRFYTRALTAAELAANHANDVAKYGGND